MDSLRVRVYATDRPSADAREANARIDAALDRELAEVRFLNRPFCNALDEVLEKIGVDAFVDWNGLEDAGIERGAPMTMRLTGVKGRVALDLLLRAGGGDVVLGYEVRGGVLAIGTEEWLGSDRVTRMYDVRGLIAAHLCGPRYKPVLDADEPVDADEVVEQLIEELINSLCITAAPDTWAVNGGCAQVMPHAGLLIVHQTRSGHRQVEAWLNTLLRALVGEVDAPASPSGAKAMQPCH
jgi:hypothetical protein